MIGYYYFASYHEEPMPSHRKFRIVEILDDEKVLMEVVYDEDIFQWWIGGFVYEEGIGGRKVVDAHHINFITVISQERASPSREEVNRVLKIVENSDDIWAPIVQRMAIVPAAS